VRGGLFSFGTQNGVSVLRACVGLLAIPVDRDTLHAVMRVCLRLTRSFENAMIFGGLGGVRLLLGLTQASSFTGFLSLSTLLIRHVMEEPRTLRHAMEKVSFCAFTSFVLLYVKLL
jgi:E3 ubiquitin-protein ligase HUWE1